MIQKERIELLASQRRSAGPIANEENRCFVQEDYARRPHQRIDRLHGRELAKLNYIWQTSTQGCCWRTAHRKGCYANLFAALSPQRGRISRPSCPAPRVKARASPNGIDDGKMSPSDLFRTGALVKRGLAIRNPCKTGDEVALRRVL